MTQPLIPTAHMPSELPPMPIDPAWIQEGTPPARGTVLTQSKDKLLSCGFWSCTAGKFKWVFSWDEFVHVLEGEVTIREEGGATHTLFEEECPARRHDPTVKRSVRGGHRVEQLPGTLGNSPIHCSHR